MLAETEKAEILAELEHYPDRRAACIDALKIVQKYRGWVSDESLQDIAQFLGLSTDEVEAVATFYSLIFREPVGRHVILVCDSVSCWMLGYPKVSANLKNLLGIEFGRTTPDDRFTLLPVACLGACDHAPVLMVDDDLHSDIKEVELRLLLERYS